MPISLSSAHLCAVIFIDFSRIGILIAATIKAQLSLCWKVVHVPSVQPSHLPDWSLSTLPQTPLQCVAPCSQCKEKWDGLFVLSFMHSSIFILQSPPFHLHLFICSSVCLLLGFHVQVPLTPFSIRPQVYTQVSHTLVTHTLSVSHCVLLE